MNINEILSGVDCPCGRRHECDIEAVYIEKGACKYLTGLTEKYNSILIVADENTYGAAGEKTVAALEAKKINKVIFSGKLVLIPDEKAIETVKASLGDADLIIGIGSGVIQDLCKYVSKFENIPYMVVATAPSMDGYASNGAAMILGGMKETVSAGLPRAIIADTEVLASAPMEMIKAGYGDIVGKYSALCDWKLSNIVNGEYLCDYIYDTTDEMITKTLSTAKGLIERNEESVGTLMEALVIVGIMMSFAGSSRPASGSEHHLSHFFEIVGIVKDEPYFAHGIDVAYSTIVTTEIREELTKKAFCDKLYRVDRTEYENKMDEVYGKVGASCVALQDKIGNYAKDRVSVYLEKEKEIKELFASVPSAKQIEDMLALVGLDKKEYYALYGEEKIQTAIKWAKDLKDRYTVLWLYFDLFGGN